MRHEGRSAAERGLGSTEAGRPASTSATHLETITPSRAHARACRTGDNRRFPAAETCPLDLVVVAPGAMERACDEVALALSNRLEAARDASENSLVCAADAGASLTTLMRLLHCGAGEDVCCGDAARGTAHSEVMVAVWQWWRKHAGPAMAEVSRDAVYNAHEFFTALIRDPAVEPKLAAAIDAIVTIGEPAQSD